MKKQFFVSLLSFFFAMIYCTTAAAESAGVVLAAIGQVNILRNGQAIPAVRKAELQAQDEVRTIGKDARAQLRFADGTVTTLGGNTSFLIRQYQFNAQGDKPNNAAFTLLTGAFRTVTGKILDAHGSTFVVNTPVGTIGIRGTDFWGGYLDGNNVDVLLIDGKHAVEVTNATGKVMLEKPGQGVTLKSSQSPLAVKVWPQKKVERAVATITWPEGSTPPTQL
ncbi:MAG: FecR family protein [Pseudomonadales bacterium]